MRKPLHIAIIVGPEQIAAISRTMKMYVGINNVLASVNPGDLLPIAEKLSPKALIIDPELLCDCDMTPQDILTMKRQYRFKIVTLSQEPPNRQVRSLIDQLCPEKEYVAPTEYLTMATELPELTLTKYVKRKELRLLQTQENIDAIFRECGFHCDTKGFVFLKEAIYMILLNPDLLRWGGGKFIYKTLSEKYGDSPRIVARSMIRFLELSMSPETEKQFRKKLQIPERTELFPLSFFRFTGIFTAYYAGVYEDPSQPIKYPRKR